MHRPDPDTDIDIDETLAALTDLVRGGKVRAVGGSFFAPEETTAQRYGMGVLTFGPLNSGRLSGRADPTPPITDKRLRRR